MNIIQSKKKIKIQCTIMYMKKTWILSSLNKIIKREIYIYLYLIKVKKKFDFYLIIAYYTKNNK